MDYSLKRWTAMTRFLDDGRICMSNNAAERAVRGIAVGRRNWTFCGSDTGGVRAAAIYTLIETCKLNRVDPRAWLAEARTSIGRYLDFYNRRRPHSSLDGATPDQAYFIPLPLRLAA
jgi:transposase InsO family protein